MATTVEASDPTLIGMDLAGRIRIPRPGAVVAAILRIGIGFVYLWSFVSQGFGIVYTNQTEGSQSVDYAWHFSYDGDAGWFTSGFKSSPSEGFVSGTDGPLAFIPQNLPTGLDDAAWMFAIGGLGIALTLGIFSRLAGWGGFALNILVWFSIFPPSFNPVIDAEHFMFAFILLLLMWIQASNYWGLGRWWRARTPALLN